MSNSGFGLEEIGIPGRDYLKEALTSCTDPLKAIEDFQVCMNFHLTQSHASDNCSRLTSESLRSENWVFFYELTVL